MKVAKLKHQTTAESYFEGLPINAKEAQECYVPILRDMHRELVAICSHYTRVVLVRVDLTVPSHIRDFEPNYGEGVFRLYIKSIPRLIKSRYGSEIAYTWVSEVGEDAYNNGIHWHLWLAVKQARDQQADTQAKEIQDLLSGAWTERMQGSCNLAGWFLLERPNFGLEARESQQNEMLQALRENKGLKNRPLVAIRERKGKLRVLGGVVDECFYALSYLAKTNTKTRNETNKFAKFWGSSEIKLIGKSDYRTSQILKARENILEALSERCSPVLASRFEKPTLVLSPPPFECDTFTIPDTFQEEAYLRFRGDMEDQPFETLFGGWDSLEEYGDPYSNHVPLFERCLEEPVEFYRLPPIFVKKYLDRRL